MFAQVTCSIAGFSWVSKDDLGLVVVRLVVSLAVGIESSWGRQLFFILISS